MKGWPWPHLMVSDWSIVYRNDATGRGDRELLFLSGAREDLTVKEALLPPPPSPPPRPFGETNSHIQRVWTRHGQGMDKAWTRHGQCMDKAWTRHGQGLDKAWPNFRNVQCMCCCNVLYWLFYGLRLGLFLENSS
jgi:hypothetical protein